MTSAGFNPVLTRNVFPHDEGKVKSQHEIVFQSCPNQECVPT